MIRSSFILLALCGMSMCLPSYAQTWRVVHPFLSHTVVLNPNDPRKLYIGNWANQLLRSNDMGKTWYTVEMGDLGVPNSITSVGVSRADTSVILAGGYFFDGIRRSSNSGQSFDRVLNDSNNAKMWFISEAIVEDPSSPGTWYAARGVQNNGIWKSTDNGATWDSISAIPSAFTSRLCTITIRPDSTNILYVGAKGGVMLRSSDRGVTWNRVPVVGGKLNIIADDSEIPKIVFSPREPLTGYAVVAITLETKISGNGGVLKTTDGGLTWDRIGFADTSFWAVDVRERNGKDEVFIGGFRINNSATIIKGDGLVYRSPDGGATWSQVTDIPWGKNELDDTIRNVWVIRCDEVTKRVYFATTPGLYVYEDELSSIASADDGESFDVHCDREAIILHDRGAPASSGTVSMYNMLGRCVQQAAIAEASTDLRMQAPSERGLYLITLDRNGRRRTATVFVE
jgi:photosystem II stability/assembly factor-like uncharacterized protein